MSERLTDVELAELERLEKAATGSPWFWDNEGGDGTPSDSACGGVHAVGGQVVCSFGQSECYDSVAGTAPDESDKKLLLAARNALPALLAEVSLSRLERAISRHRSLYNAGKPEISDAEYGALEEKLRVLDPDNK